MLSIYYYESFWVETPDQIECIFLMSFQKDSDKLFLLECTEFYFQ